MFNLLASYNLYVYIKNTTSLLYQILLKKSIDELSVMNGGKCILQLRGVRPFFSDKYDITCHKQYPMLLDDNPEMEFDIEKYVSELKSKHLKISR